MILFNEISVSSLGLDVESHFHIEAMIRDSIWELKSVSYNVKGTSFVSPSHKNIMNGTQKVWLSGIEIFPLTPKYYFLTFSIVVSHIS